MFEGVAKRVQGFEKLQQHLEDAVKEYCRQDASLKKSDVKQKEPCCPVFGFDHSHHLLVVIENESLDVLWNVVPSQSELNEIVAYTSIGICKVQPRDHDLAIFRLGFFEGFKKTKSFPNTREYQLGNLPDECSDS